MSLQVTNVITLTKVITISFLFQIYVYNTTSQLNLNTTSTTEPSRTYTDEATNQHLWAQFTGIITCILYVLRVVIISIDIFLFLLLLYFWLFKECVCIHISIFAHYVLAGILSVSIPIASVGRFVFIRTLILVQEKTNEQLLLKQLKSFSCSISSGR